MNAHADEGYQDAEDDAAEQRVAKHLAGFAESLIQAERRRVAEERGEALTPDTQAGDLN